MTEDKTIDCNTLYGLIVPLRTEPLKIVMVRSEPNPFHAFKFFPARNFFKGLFG